MRADRQDSETGVDVMRVPVEKNWDLPDEVSSLLSGSQAGERFGDSVKPNVHSHHYASWADSVPGPAGKVGPD